MSAEEATNAGAASVIRNAATPASTTRIRIPAPLAEPAKMRSASCTTALGAVGAAVAWGVRPGLVSVLNSSLPTIRAEVGGGARKPGRRHHDVRPGSLARVLFFS